MKKSQILSIFATLLVLLGTITMYSCTKFRDEISPKHVEEPASIQTETMSRPSGFVALPIPTDLLSSTGVVVEEARETFSYTDSSNNARTGEILYSDEPDVRYHCVCVEQTDFAPILFEDVIARIEAEGGTVGFRNGNGPTM
jgi:hypothetical protein